MKIDRLVSIIMVLLDKKRISSQALADMFEVSQRTIYRDVETINMAGIPIRSTPGVGGGFEIMEEYKLEKKVFSSSDLSAILMGLSSLSSMVRGEEVVQALAKVKSFIPADQAKEISLKANRIYIDLSPWLGNRNVQLYIGSKFQSLCKSSNPCSMHDVASFSRLVCMVQTMIPRLLLMLESSHSALVDAP